MSSGRRLIATVGLALLTVAGGARSGRAQAGAPAGSEIPAAPGAGEVVDASDLPAPPLDAIPPEPAAMSPAPATDLDLPGGPADLVDIPADPSAPVEAPAVGGALAPTAPAPPAGSPEAPLDPEVMPVQEAAPPEATSDPAETTPTPAPDAAEAPSAAGGPYLPPVDRLPVGPQAAGVSIQVIVPPAMNLNKPATVTIQVKNTGASDALGVVVRDQLPEGVKYVDARPAPLGEPVGGLLTWNLGDLPAGTERQLVVTIEPTAIGNQDHAATVHFMAGSRARTLVQEPKLRVEQAATRGPVLRGKQVQFDIVVTNTGTGPASDVVVLAEMSEGLSHPTEGRILELALAGPPFNKTTLAPGESIRLPELIVDTVGGGEQTCTVTVTSPDVNEAPEARKVATVTVVEPKLEVVLDGPPTRYTDFDADYTLTVSNPGTAPAEDVRITATLVGDARPYQPGRGGTWDAGRRSITWTIPRLEPGQDDTYTFRVRLGGVGSFQVNGSAVARGGLKAGDSISTSVEGSAYLELDVTEELRLLDVGKRTVFKLKIRNVGTKEALQVQAKAQLSDTLKAVETAGTEQQAWVPEGTNTVQFPTIDRLAPGKELTLYILAEAVKDGLATCRAFLSHQDIQYQIEDVANATVIPAPRR